ncbi:MAG: disulfide bond formation protein B [Chloroflexi bacterium]|nr:disulfide bond formation protein B [Chloroflexota bacterium]
MQDARALLGRNILYLAWAQACIATFGSLYFSEVMKFPPCTLCWYQRILMYPLVLVIAVGILRRDAGVHQYVLPIAVLGLVISVYHNLLYFRIIPEEIQPCTVGIPCTTIQIEWFGFITIPLMSMTAFTVIAICMAIHRRMAAGT